MPVRTLSRAAIFAAVLTIALLASGRCEAQVVSRITVAADPVVDSATVKLGQIAKIIAPQQIAERLSQISLGYAPEPGASRHLTRAQLLMSIRAAGFQEGSFVLVADERTSIGRTFQTVDEPSVIRAVSDALRAKYAGEAVSVEILNVSVPPSVRVAAGSLEIIAKPLPRVASLIEPFQVPLEIKVDGKLVRTLSATAAIAVNADVLVARSALDPAVTIASADVRLHKVRIAKGLEKYVRNIAQLKGYRVVRPLAVGEPLMLDSVVAAAVVRAGDTVKIEAVSGRTRVVATGEARSAGKIGDRISIKNKASGAVLQAVVVDEGLVKVTF